MMKIGITGGIGSGKTTVCNFFLEKGIPVYFADNRAKELMQSDPVLIQAITQEFGDSVYLTDGRLDRANLATIVFQNPEKLKRLESMVHPAVFRDFARWVEEEKKSQPPFILKEAALLVESGAYKRLDKLIVVLAPIETRLKRIQDRDQSSKEQVMARVQAQISDEEKTKHAHYIIKNEGDLDSLKKQVDSLYLQIRGNS